MTFEYNGIPHAGDLSPRRIYRLTIPEEGAIDHRGILLVSRKDELDVKLF